MSQHHRDLGITLLDAKYLDPACHKGCQSLIHQHEKIELRTLLAFCEGVLRIVEDHRATFSMDGVKEARRRIAALKI